MKTTVLHNTFDYRDVSWKWSSIESDAYLLYSYYYYYEVLLYKLIMFKTLSQMIMYEEYIIEILYIYMEIEIDHNQIYLIFILLKVLTMQSECSLIYYLIIRRWYLHLMKYS